MDSIWRMPFHQGHSKISLIMSCLFYRKGGEFPKHMKELPYVIIYLVKETNSLCIMQENSTGLSNWSCRKIYSIYTIENIGLREHLRRYDFIQRFIMEQ